MFTCWGRIVSWLGGCLTPSHSNPIGRSTSVGIVERWVSNGPLLLRLTINDQRGIIVSSFLALSRQLPITSEDAVWTSLSVLPLIACSSLRTHSVEAHTSLRVWPISQWMSTHQLSSVWNRLCCSSFQGRHLPSTTPPSITTTRVVPATQWDAAHTPPPPPPPHPNHLHAVQHQENTSVPRPEDPQGLGSGSRLTPRLL